MRAPYRMASGTCVWSDNDLARVSLLTPATAGGTSTRTNNIEKIDAGDHFFSDGSTLVPPYAPVLEKVLQTILISGILDGESF